MTLCSAKQRGSMLYSSSWTSSLTLYLKWERIHARGNHYHERSLWPSPFLSLCRLTLWQVLGFDDAPLLTSDSRVSSCVDLSLQTMASEGESPRQLRPRREPSDPFLDASAQLKDIRDTRRYERATPISAATETGLSRLLPLDDGFDRPEENQMRIWLAPDLSNPEYSSLTSLFPSAIRARTLPRFTTRPSINKSLDLESGTMSEVRSEVRCGTGRMWLSRTERSGRWRGSWWNRFCHWWTTVLSFW